MVAYIKPCTWIQVVKKKKGKSEVAFSGKTKYCGSVLNKAEAHASFVWDFSLENLHQTTVHDDLPSLLHTSSRSNSLLVESFSVKDLPSHKICNLIISDTYECDFFLITTEQFCRMFTGPQNVIRHCVICKGAQGNSFAEEVRFIKQVLCSD